MIKNNEATNAQEISEWITYGALWNPNSEETGYGMHVQNHSWAWASDANLIWEAVFFCARNAVVFVGASGNDQNTQSNYPASYKDEWVLKTGASDTSGAKASFSTYGNNLDFLAPGTADLYTGMSSIGPSYTDTYSVGVADGTSFAAPHVSGVASLFQSYALNNGLHLFAPEDIEYFLQENALDIYGFGSYSIGYDELSGHGRIQADSALSAVKYPKYEVKHVSASIPINATPILTNQQRVLGRNYGPIAAGSYTVDIYQASATITHSIGSKTLIDSWKRDGASTLWGYTGSVSDTIQPEPSIDLALTANTSAIVVGYIYKFYLASGGTAFLPISNTGNATFAYSLYLDDESINDLDQVQEQTSQRFEIFPNPGADVQSIYLANTTNENIQIKLYDLNGRLVRNIYSGVPPPSMMLNVDVSQLNTGMYVYQLRTAAKTEYRKTIISR